MCRALYDAIFESKEECNYERLKLCIIRRGEQHAGKVEDGDKMATIIDATVATVMK